MVGDDLPLVRDYNILTSAQLSSRTSTKKGGLPPVADGKQ